MATVAERRFDDAEALIKTGDNARANGAAYLAGFVVEILLKARLIRKFPQIARKRQHEVTDPERRVWRLIWKAHDLDGMLVQLSSLEVALRSRGDRDGIDYLEDLKTICGTWTIQARYSPRTMLIGDAREILERVRRLKELLK
jgi:HEPN domain-containing protein